jgi:hypothetical protein
VNRRRPAVTASTHLAGLLSSADQATSAATLPFDEWALQVPEPKGELDFDRFPFQRELYRSSVDQHEVVIKKAAQVGVSALCIRWVMYWAGARGLTALYVFPRQRQLRDFSDARIKPLIATSPLLQELVAAGAVQNNGLKRLGVGHLILRGSESVADLQAVDADVLVLDEYDDLVQNNVPDDGAEVGRGQDRDAVAMGDRGRCSVARSSSERRGDLVLAQPQRRGTQSPLHVTAPSVVVMVGGIDLADVTHETRSFGCAKRWVSTPGLSSGVIRAALRWPRNSAGAASTTP